MNFWLVSNLMEINDFSVLIQKKNSFFLDLNIKVIGNFIHTSVYHKRDDFVYLIVNISWLCGDVPGLPLYCI